MKAVAFVFFLFLSMTSCNSEAERAESTNADTSVSMKIAPDTVGNSSPTQDSASAVKEPSYGVALSVLFTRQYCGGAQPSEEILKEYEAPNALSNSTLRLRNHFSQKEYTCVLGSGGNSTQTMEAGKYDVYLTSSIDKSLNTGFDPACKLWRDKPVATIKITPEKKTYSVTINFECNPCDGGMKLRP